MGLAPTADGKGVCDPTLDVIDVNTGQGACEAEQNPRLGWSGRSGKPPRSLAGKSGSGSRVPLASGNSGRAGRAAPGRPLAAARGGRGRAQGCGVCTHTSAEENRSSPTSNMGRPGSPPARRAAPGAASSFSRQQLRACSRAAAAAQPRPQ
ncbi:MAG: hypothetical protein J3K34DRAFT_432488 [Monoraphidium minutum]|nr:MAG: hypothetical protein J3K34DRAFT_432488 [Monoraphidium minutum]